MRHTDLRSGLLLICLLIFGAGSYGAQSGRVSAPRRDQARPVSSPVQSSMRIIRGSWGLDGRKVIVRCYTRWGQEPAAFTGVESTIQDDAFTLKKADLPASTILALCAEDQTDTSVCQMLGKGIYAATLAEEPAAKQKVPAKPDTQRRIALGAFSFDSHAKKESLVIRDALGAPMAEAEIKMLLWPDFSFKGPHIEVLKVPTDEAGRIELPPVQFDRTGQPELLISHPEYGLGEYRGALFALNQKKELRLPLVRGGSPARERALRGVILDPEGRPVAGARVIGDHVRTPGEGLIQSYGQTVRSDAAGRFCIYLFDLNPRGERGDLTPPGSRYQIRVDAPERLDLPPYARALANDGEVTIRLERGNRRRHFAFQDETGKPLDPRLLQSLLVHFWGGNNGPGRGPGDGNNCGLDYQDIAGGGFFSEGTYIAQVTDKKFLPVQLKADSPAELIFSMPSKFAYQGRVLHGVSGAPLKDAFVFLSNGMTDKRLAQISPEEWQKMHAAPTGAKADDPAFQPLRDCMTLSAITRTDGEGRYRLECLAGQDVYGVTVCERDFLSLGVRVSDRKPTGREPLQMEDIKLFPAATVLVQFGPAAEPNLLFSPAWSVEKEKAPKLHELLTSPNNGNFLDRYCWVKGADTQPVQIPAGMKVSLTLRPNNEQCCPVTFPEPFALKQGERLKVGPIVLRKTVLVAVEVLDGGGKPVEGIPVSRLTTDKEGMRGWSVVHNTDQVGLAYFYVEPGSKGEFGAYKYRGGGEQLEVKVPYQIGDKTPSDPVATLRLTGEQIKQLLAK